MTSLSLFQQVVGIFSVDRLDAYRVSTADSELDALTRYVWNVALCEALYPVLHCLEVGLRNRLNQALVSSFGRADWYDASQVILDVGARQKVTAVKLMLNASGKKVTPSRIISELSFGFWTMLISRHHQSIIARPGLLKEAFPYVPKSMRKRRILSGRFGEARKLRNRVFHHEPIWHRDVQREYQNIIEALGWLDPCLLDVCAVLDRFSLVCTDSFRRQIKRQLNLRP